MTPDLPVGEAESLTRAMEGTGRAAREAMQAVAEGASASRAALRDASAATADLSGALRSSLGGAFRAAALEGKGLSDVLRGLALDLSRAVASKAIGGLADSLGGALGDVLPFAQGGVIDAGRIRRFAQGGVVTRPTAFGLAGGTGLMGEAGPEAILPLGRDASGRLGVRGAASTTVNVTINATDAESVMRSRGQVAAALARAVEKGRGRL